MSNSDSDARAEAEDAAAKKEGTEEEEKLSLWQTIVLLSKASRGFWAVNLVNFGDGIAYFGILGLLVLFLEHDTRFGTYWASVGVSSFAGLVTVGMFLGGGFISDWLGVRRALTLSLVLVLIGRLLLVIAPWFGATTPIISFAIFALVVMGLGEAVIQPALYAGVKEYSDKRTQTMGYALIYAIMNLGIVAEQAVSPLIRDFARELEGRSEDPAGGISGVYWFIVGVTVLLLLAHLFLFTKRVEQTQRVMPDKSDDEEEAPKSLKERLLNIPILNPKFLFFIFILLPVRTLFAHQWLTIPPYVMRCFPPEVGERFEWISGLNPFIIVIGVPLLAAWTRNVNIILMMIIGTSISALSTWLLVPEPNIYLLLLYVMIFSLGEAAWSSRFLEYVAELAPAGKVGAYMGIATLPWFLAKSTTGWYSGAMLDAFVPTDGPHDTATMWTIYALVALISPIGLMIGKRWVERDVKNAT